MTMTRHDLAQIKRIPGFDCVKLKNEIQAKIYEETKNMSSEEVLEYIRQGSERFRKKIAELQRQMKSEEGE